MVIFFPCVYTAHQITLRLFPVYASRNNQPAKHNRHRTVAIPGIIQYFGHLEGFEWNKVCRYFEKQARKPALVGIKGSGPVITLDRSDLCGPEFGPLYTVRSVAWTIRFSRRTGPDEIDIFGCKMRIYSRITSKTFENEWKVKIAQFFVLVFSPFVNTRCVHPKSVVREVCFLALSLNY